MYSAANKWRSSGLIFLALICCQFAIATANSSTDAHKGYLNAVESTTSITNGRFMRKEGRKAQKKFMETEIQQKPTNNSEADISLQGVPHTLWDNVATNGKLAPSTTLQIPVCPITAEHVNIQLSADEELSPTCIIRDDVWGLAGVILTTLANVKLCVDKGYVPNISWRLFSFCPCQEYNQESCPTTNCFTHYFENPLDLAVAESIEASRLLSNVAHGAETSSQTLCFRQALVKQLREALISNPSALQVAHDKELRQEFARLANKHFRLKRAWQNKIRKLWRRHVRGRRVLGVQIRGTDYTNRGAQPPLSMYIERARMLLHDFRRRGHADAKIFVASDDNEAVQAFKGEFGDRVFFSDAARVQAYNADDWLHCGRRPDDDRDDNATNIPGEACGLGVISDIFLLASCDQFLYWESSVSKLAMLFNANLEAHHVNASLAFTERLSPFPERWKEEQEQEQEYLEEQEHKRNISFS